MRSYTVTELDALRSAVKEGWLFGSCRDSVPGGFRMSRSYQTGEMEKAVEELVRTHMIAGHIAEDLIAADSPK